MSAHYQIEQKMAISALNSLYEAANNPEVNKTKKFQIQYTDIESIKKNFIRSHCKYADKRPKGFDEDNHQNVYDDFMDKYYSIKVLYSDLYDDKCLTSRKLNSNKNEGHVCARSELSLPKIKLPNFDGSITQFQSFISVYRSLIHENTTLNAVQKLHHLMSCLSGDAAGLVKHLPITDSNYAVAYDLLVKRYDNKRLIADTHLENILNLNNIQSHTNCNLRSFVDILKENMRALEALGFPIPEWSFILLHIISKKMDMQLRNFFELQCKDINIPTFSDLIEFLETRCKALEASKLQVPNNIRESLNKPKVKLAHTASVEKQCPCCKQDSHQLFVCERFLNLPLVERRDFVRKNRVCYNCLRPHMSKYCKSRSNCKQCRGFHHTLLHDNNYKSSDVSSDLHSARPQVRGNELHDPEPTSSTEVSVLSSTFQSSGDQQNRMVLLATAIIHVQHANGSWSEARALIDTGSEASFITSSCVRKLRLLINDDHSTILGLGGNTSQHSLGKVVCRFKSRYSATPILISNTYVLQNITKDLPSKNVSQKVVQHFINYELADPTFYKRGKIDILIGSDLYDSILENCHMVKSTAMLPGAIKTIFGWVLSGKSIAEPDTSSSISSFHTICETDLSGLISKFWESEEPPTLKRIISPEDDQCEKHFQSTYSRDQLGRFVVRLPFQSNNFSLGNSRNLALKRLYSLERRFKRDTLLKSMYSDFLREYENLGHMTLLSGALLMEKGYYIPHHGVLKASSSTTKLRVVFDASMASDNGVSLNNVLLSGPKLQHHISDIILRFRVHQVVFICDIKQMYRQVTIHPSDRCYQRILWRNNTTDEVGEYELNTVTYGVTTAPYLAMRALHQLALDGSNKFPNASQVLLRDIFVDDLVTGTSSITEAIKLKSELICLLQTGGFELRKWCSNNANLLKDLPHDHYEVPLNLESKEDFIVKVLGVRWSSINDSFLYDAHLDMHVYTKRTLLSNIARLFDPCGWLSPVTFTAKAMMQQLWLLQIGWDDRPPEEILSQWTEFSSQFHLLQKIVIPRSIIPLEVSDSQLHGFSDASERGFSGVVYIRTTDSMGNVKVQILVAKSKVAPIKQRLTVPRLELNGALLVSKLIVYVQNVLTNIKFSSKYIWCDSTVVLSWLQKSPHSLRMYEGNRVSQIHNLVETNMWRYIPSALNPADASSRGLSPQDLISHELWWGPKWLCKPSDQWPSQSRFCNETSTLDNTNEIRCQVSQNQESDDILLYKYSSFSKLGRITALCQRFIYNCRNMKSKQVGPLTTGELSSAQLYWIGYVQNIVFYNEINNIKHGHHCRTSLIRLAPFIDSSGIVRVGGRLKNSCLPYESKHPILLPRSHHLTNIIIDYFHIKYLHVGPNSLHSILRQQYWILSGRQIVRFRIFKCVTCFRNKPRYTEPFMGELPQDRVLPNRAFSKVAADFAGPFQIKSSNLRRPKIEKAYLCVFVCMSTKAIHLEMVCDLSTRAFLAAFDRFTSRRGLCSDIYTDNATNFRGANNHLKELYTMLSTSSNILYANMAERRVKWHFSPANAPHFNGISEAAVKLCKYHLRRVIGDQCLTFEELYTLICKVEAILNSRPLCPMSSDPNDYNILTPGHFLIGSTLLSLPEDNIEDKRNVRNRWQLFQHMSRCFWKQWTNNYLHTLQQRNKWFTQTENLKLNDLVIIREDDIPPLKWRLGRVVKVYPGADSIIRAVQLKTAKGLVERPAVKVCLLPQ